MYIYIGSAASQTQGLVYSRSSGGCSAGKADVGYNAEQVQRDGCKFERADSTQRSGTGEHRANKVNLTHRVATAFQVNMEAIRCDLADALGVSTQQLPFISLRHFVRLFAIISIQSIRALLRHLVCAAAPRPLHHGRAILPSPAQDNHERLCLEQPSCTRIA